MKKDEKKDAARKALLEKAERAAAKRAAGAPGKHGLSPEALIHELEVHQIELEMQNEELRAAQEALEHSRSLYVELYDFAPTGYLTLNGDGVILMANLTAAAMLGGSRGTVVGKPFGLFLHEESTACLFSFLKQVCGAIGPQQCEVRIKGTGAAPHYILMDGLGSADGPGGEKQCRASLRDISDRKADELRLKALVEEKEFLMREMHHRVKNNYMLTMSLIGLQESGSDNPEVKKHLLALKGRVQSMSLVHNYLSMSEAGGTVAAAVYINSLLSEIKKSYAALNEGVSLNAGVPADIVFDINRAIPLGLIINEAVTNAYKHAFAGRDTGTIAVSMDSLDPGSLTLTIEDDGIGLPEANGGEKSSSLGLMLIRLIAEKQLQGKYQISGGKGTRHRVTITQS